MNRQSARRSAMFRPALVSVERQTLRTPTTTRKPRIAAIGALLALLAVGAPAAASPPRIDHRHVALKSPRRGSSQVSAKTAIILVVWEYSGSSSALVKQVLQDLVLTDLSSGSKLGFGASAARRARPLRFVVTVMPNQTLAAGHDYRVQLPAGTLTPHGLDASFFVGHRVRVRRLWLKPLGSSYGLAFRLSQPVDVQAMRQAVRVVDSSSGAAVSATLQSACAGSAKAACNAFRVTFPSGFSPHDVALQLDAQPLAAAGDYLDGRYALSRAADASSATSFALAVKAGDFGSGPSIWACGSTSAGGGCSKRR